MRCRISGRTPFPGPPGRSHGLPAADLLRTTQPPGRCGSFGQLPPGHRTKISPGALPGRQIQIPGRTRCSAGSPAGLRSPALLDALMDCLLLTCCGPRGHQAGADPPGSSLRAAARRSPPEPSRAARSRTQAEHSWLRISGRTPDRPQLSGPPGRYNGLPGASCSGTTRPHGQRGILRAAPSGPQHEDLPRSPPRPPDPGRAAGRKKR